MRYRFKVEYDGQSFAGWQVQPGQMTVQRALEEAFAKVLRTDIKVYGSGRTDAGVHAKGQVVQMDYEGEIDPFKITKNINGILPETVAIREFESCDDEFSARFDATSRYYIYTIQTQKSPLSRERTWRSHFNNLNIEAIKTAAQDFIGVHNFEDYCIPRNDGKSTYCELTRFEVISQGSSIEFHIAGNRFLHRMVRAMVGTLVEIGRERYPVGIVKNSFENPGTAPRYWAPAEGLVLEQVLYPDY